MEVTSWRPPSPQTISSLIRARRTRSVKPYACMAWSRLGRCTSSCGTGGGNGKLDSENRSHSNRNRRSRCQQQRCADQHRFHAQQSSVSPFCRRQFLSRVLPEPRIILASGRAQDCCGRRTDIVTPNQQRTRRHHDVRDKQTCCRCNCLRDSSLLNRCSKDQRRPQKGNHRRTQSEGAAQLRIQRPAILDLLPQTPKSDLISQSRPGCVLRHQPAPAPCSPPSGP